MGGGGTDAKEDFSKVEFHRVIVVLRQVRFNSLQASSLLRPSTSSGLRRAGRTSKARCRIVIRSKNDDGRSRFTAAVT